MKRKMIRVAVAAVLLVALTATTAFAASICDTCKKSSTLTRYSCNNNSYHIVKCLTSSCNFQETESHTIRDYTTRECVVCGDIIGD